MHSVSLSETSGPSSGPRFHGHARTACAEQAGKYTHNFPIYQRFSDFLPQKHRTGLYRTCQRERFWLTNSGKIFRSMLRRGSKSPPRNMRKSCYKCRVVSGAPPPRSYRRKAALSPGLRPTTPRRHPYRLRSIRSDTGRRLPIRETADRRRTPGSPMEPSGYRNRKTRPCGAGTPPPARSSCYQLAFLTPGIRPLEAISRNWIRLIPNRRM